MSGGRPVQRGAALLLAMMIVALVSTLAAGMVWQQFRAVQVEAAERSRTQSAWVLNGALDWSRLILREDGRSSSNDHLGEPWATPLAEARLSTFLAADKDNNADSGPEAFLSGSITDAQSRYNLRNLFGPDGKLLPAEYKSFQALCTSAGVTPDVVNRLVQGLAASWRPNAADTADDSNRPLPIQRLDQLTWLGIEPKTVTAMAPFFDVLPERTPINANTAPREVLAAVLGVDLGTAERLVQMRQRSAFTTVEALNPYLPAPPAGDGTPAAGAPPEGDNERERAAERERARTGQRGGGGGGAGGGGSDQRFAVSTAYFHVAGRLRLEERVLEDRSLVQRRGTGTATEVVVVRRDRAALHTGTP